MESFVTDRFEEGLLHRLVETHAIGAVLAATQPRSRVDPDPRPTKLVHRTVDAGMVSVQAVLRDWNTFVEVPTGAAVERIAGLAESGTLRLERIVRASATEPPRVRERLRRLLEAIGHSSDAAAVRPARSDLVRDDLVLAG